MENEPEKPQSPVPPPPDVPPPSPGPAVPPPPNLEPPPPAPAPPMPDMPPPPPVTDPYVPPKSQEPAKFDSDEEGVSTEGKEAGLDARIIAAVIDAFVGSFIYLVFGKLGFVLGYLASTAYYLSRDALPFLDGQSIGKKLIKIRAVDLNGKSLSGNWQASIMRNVGLVIPFFGLLEAYILYTKKNEGAPMRRLGDEWGKTKVIVVKQESPI